MGVKVGIALAASAVVGGGLWFGLKDSKYTTIGALVSLAIGYLVQKWNSKKFILWFMIC